MVAEANKLATSVPTWKNIEFALSTTVITKLSNYVQLVQEQSSRQLSRLEQGLKSLGRAWNAESVNQVLSNRCAYLNGLLAIRVFLPNWDAPF